MRGGVNFAVVMEMLRCIFVVVLAAAAGFVAGVSVGCKESAAGVCRTVEVVRDTVTVRDTVVVERPVAVERRLTDTIMVRVAATDTCVALTDSVDVLLRAESVRYAGDRYEAWVSGYRPRLDSLRIYGEDRVVNSVVAVPATGRRRRWGVGVAAGVALTPSGVGPGVVVGVTYSL